MLLELEEPRGYFTSTTQKEYVRKKVRRILKAVPFYPELDDNPICDAFKEYLYTDKKREQLTLPNQPESLKEYFDKVLCKYPHLKKFLPQEPPDQTLIEREQKKLLRSVYQISYSKDLDVKKGESIKIELPENCSIPETINQQSYRNPRHFGGTDVLKSRKTAKIPDNLTPNEEERKRLRIRTGDSEYQTFIGKVGKRIIKEQFYGPPIPIDPPAEKIHTNDSTSSSLCSLVLKNASKKHVLSNIFY